MEAEYESRLAALKTAEAALKRFLARHGDMDAGLSTQRSAFSRQA